ncbi:hypothetical protein HDU84_005567 [Entophlyctis sp. JEL0112]|nr:hypothetical protein HDU84_005567 [Entophlyctis sp. JEL0112]
MAAAVPASIPQQTPVLLAVIDRCYSVPLGSLRNPEVPYFPVEHSAIPLELSARIPSERVLGTIEKVNSLLEKGFLVSWGSVAKAVGEFFLFVRFKSDYDVMLERLEAIIREENGKFESARVRLRNPRDVAFLRLEFELF